MNRRQLGAAAAVLLAVLTLAGCSNMDAEDQAVIDRLAKADIVTVPAGATKMSSTEAKGGGSNLVAIRGASSVELKYASPLPPAGVREFYLSKYDKGWFLKD